MDQTYIPSTSNGYAEQQTSSTVDIRRIVVVAAAASILAYLALAPRLRRRRPATLGERIAVYLKEGGRALNRAAEMLQEQASTVSHNVRERVM